MKRVIVIGATLATLVAPVGNAAAEPNESAACVGAFSSFFAHDGLGMHRSDVAQDFAHNAQPAGNVYSHVAEFHGSLDDCFEQT
ncbi:MAG TPA: hypothetical protein VFR63_07440 [Gaiellaceae bacterium]|nr:hypothetical protein [Gaiellaceae bacterium]